MMKRMVFLMVSFLFLIMVGCSASTGPTFGDTDSNPTEEKESAEPLTEPSFEIVEKKYTSEHMDVSYPKVNGLEDRQLQERINQILYEEAFEHKPDYKKIDENQVDEEEWNFESKYKVTYNQDGLVSIRYDTTFYVLEAAHPTSGINSITFSIRDGTIYQLPDLFKKTPSYRGKINDYIIRYLSEREEEIPLLRPFTGIDEGQGFYLTEKGTAIYFQEYEYTPYAYGSLVIVVPYSQLALDHHNYQAEQSVEVVPGASYFDDEFKQLAAEGKLKSIPFEIGTEMKQIVETWGEPHDSGLFEGAKYYMYDKCTFFSDINGRKVTGLSITPKTFSWDVVPTLTDIRSLLGTPKEDIGKNEIDGDWNMGYQFGDYRLYITSDGSDHTIKSIFLGE